MLLRILRILKPLKNEFSSDIFCSKGAFDGLSRRVYALDSHYAFRIR